MKKSRAVCLALGVVVLFHSSSNLFYQFNGLVVDERRKVVIFAATQFFKSPITSERFLNECSSGIQETCRLTTEIGEYKTADAVLFYNYDFPKDLSLFQNRNIQQLFVLWSLESPSNDQFRAPPSFINWTMTYRRDADIWFPYGRMVKRDRKSFFNFTRLWKSKDHNKTSVWIGSNCVTQNFRQLFIRRLLTEGLKVDVFGGCGGRVPYNCEGLHKQSDECMTSVVRPYKFYISIENSNCVDYVTEKLYETLRSRYAVPIVLKRSYYEELKIPSSSFIAIDDFPNIGSFVNYVNLLSNDRKMYSEYHRWREDYRVISGTDDSTGFCELCKRLQRKDYTEKVYEDVQQWSSIGKCDNNYAHKTHLDIK